MFSEQLPGILSLLNEEKPLAKGASHTFVLLPFSLNNEKHP